MLYLELIEKQKKEGLQRFADNLDEVSRQIRKLEKELKHELKERKEKLYRYSKINDILSGNHQKKMLQIEVEKSSLVV